LSAERDGLRAFIALLEKEQQALLDQDNDRLLALAETKTQFSNKLAEIINARRQFQDAQAIGQDVSAWIAKHAPANRAIWDEIRELAARAHQMNQTNGEVIQLKLRSNQQALTALLGAAKNASAGLYGRDGQPNLTVSGRTLGNV
jgi:flagella synthesis protein FlgN